MRFLLPILLFATSTAVAAPQGIYRWTDDQGVTHYSDKQPADQKAQHITLAPLKTATPQPAPVTSTDQESNAASADSQTGTEAADLAGLEFQEESTAQGTESTKQAITLYTWVDEKGIKHFGNQPPADGKATKIDLKQPAADAPTIR